MSDSPSTLPPRPSLDQLRKQAKERVRAAPGATLAGAQFALAREYGFESWPKLVHHVEALAAPEVQQQEQIARDMAAAYHQRDDAAAARLNDLFHSALDVDQIRRFIEDRLVHVPGGRERLAHFGVADARLLVARLYGFEDWDALVSSIGSRDESFGITSAPPFLRIDAARGILEPRQPMSAHDWDTLIGVMKERGLTGLDARNMMDDAALERLAAALPDLTVLKLHGSDRVTDRGLRHLARFGSLEDIELGGWKSPMTDEGFAALRGLPRLRRIASWWSRRLTDPGVASTLAACPLLEDVDFMGGSVGDGVIAALAGRPEVSRVFTGAAVTDAALPRLQEYPRFVRWHGGTPSYSLLEFHAGPTYLGLQGAFSADGLRSLQALHGLFALKLQWKAGTLNSTALAHLAPMEHLGFLGIEGDTCDDEAMRRIASLPRLRMLLAQEPVAGDAGFDGLSRSATIEHIWGRECPNLGGRGFAALSSMPALKGLAVSCKYVDDASLAALPRFPSLRALMPMDVSDEGFRHVGRCERLEELWCMYCRGTGDVATGHVADLRLKTYYAGFTKITDRSLEILSRMTTLERVELYGCHGITDAGVSRLARLPQLRQLSIETCRNVTRKGLSGFTPRVRVSYSTA